MGNAIIPIMILIIVTVGYFSKIKLFEIFTEGVKEGLHTIFNLFPIFLGLFLAVSLFRASGLISIFSSFLRPILNLLQVPAELVGLVILKPISGSASLAVFSEIVQEYSATSFISFIAAIIMGSTETLVYSIAVYSGSINKKMSYKVVVLAVLGNILSVFLASFLGRLFF